MKLFNFVRAIWSYMNGKKANTGNIMLLLAAALFYFDIDIDPEQLRQYVELLVESGAIVSIGGLIHQAIKYFKEKG